MNREQFEKEAEEISAAYEPVHPSVADAIRYSEEREAYSRAIMNAYPKHFVDINGEKFIVKALTETKQFNIGANGQVSREPSPTDLPPFPFIFPTGYCS